MCADSSKVSSSSKTRFHPKFSRRSSAKGDVWGYLTVSSLLSWLRPNHSWTLMSLSRSLFVHQWLRVETQASWCIKHRLTNLDLATKIKSLTSYKTKGHILIILRQDKNCKVTKMKRIAMTQKKLCCLREVHLLNLQWIHGKKSVSHKL